MDGGGEAGVHRGWRATGAAWGKEGEAEAALDATDLSAPSPRSPSMEDSIGREEVWEMLGRIRVALMDAGLPEHAMDDAETFDDEVREIEKGIRLLAEGRDKR